MPTAKFECEKCGQIVSMTALVMPEKLEHNCDVEVAPTTEPAAVTVTPEPAPKPKAKPKAAAKKAPVKKVEKEPEEVAELALD